MQNIEYILSLAASTTGLLITALTFIIKFIKNEKAKLVAQRTIDMGNKILLLVEEAEEFETYSGQEKKIYVTEKAKGYADEHNIPFNEQFTSKKIDEIIKTTKKVNHNNN